MTEGSFLSALTNRRVFVSHSSKDTEVVEAVKHAFTVARLDFDPYFVEDQPVGGPPSKEIVDVIKKSEALFSFFTPNSVDGDTRDWIIFELGVALPHEVPIFAWKNHVTPGWSLSARR